MGLSKKCNKCSEVKSIAYFYRQNKGLLGRTGECKECRRIRTKTWTENNKDKKRASDKNRSKRIDRSEYNREWRSKNKQYFRDYYKQNSEIRLAANKRFWENHPERYESLKIYQVARNSGKLKNPNQCQMCGTKEQKIQAHHFDYSKPLEVTWVCLECHKGIHKKKKFTKTK